MCTNVHIRYPGLDDHDLDEHLCLQAARQLGLRAARSSLDRVAARAAACRQALVAREP